jgi:hypothetical protein
LVGWSVVSSRSTNCAAGALKRPVNNLNHLAARVLRDLGYKWHGSGSFTSAMRLVASNGSWWQPSLLAAGLVVLFPTFSLADDQVWTKSINLTGNAAFTRSTADLVLAIDASALSGLGSSSGSISLRGNQSSSIVGAPGETVTLNIRNFVLTAHSTLTLQGTATTSFIINVAKQFSLSGRSRIILSGGLEWDHVFFNVLRRGSVVSLSGNAQLYGTLTATLRTVKMGGHSVVYGAVTAKRILLTGAARIILPPIASP